MIADWIRVVAMAVSMSGVPHAVAQQTPGPRETGRVRVRNLGEVSGLVVSRKNPDVLWVHNDGWDRNVFAITTAGQLVARVRIPASLIDVEDIAFGPGPEEGVDYIYLGDIGDNASSRPEIRVARFAEPSLGNRRERLDASDVEEIRLRYPDGPHDAEALMVDPKTGDLFIAVKEDSRSRLYRAAAATLQAGAPVTLELVSYLNVEGISAGDISPSGDLIILRSEDRGWIWSRPSGMSVAAAFPGAPRTVLVRAASQAQNGEAVGFTPDGKSYYTLSEGEQEGIAIFPVPAGLGTLAR